MDLKLSELLGETTEYDKKREVEMRKPKSWLKSISAFANGTGGTLIFGIADDDTVIGIEDIKGTSEFVSQKIKERIDPFPEVTMQIHSTEEGKNLLIVEVMKGQETPYYYHGDGSTEAFVRIGNESVTANAAELKRLVLRGKNSSFDSLVTDYDFKDYSFSKLRERYKEWNGTSMPEKSFESFGIVDEKGKLTNAGALLADNCPIRYSRLFCTHWNGLDKSGGQVDALDSAEYSGSLIMLLNEGVGFVKRNMKMLWKKTANSRIEMPDFCERSVFESLVNGLIHRDYLVNGSEVHIDIFGRLGYMERQGSGLNKICEAYENAANYDIGMEPQFYSDRVMFMVTLKNLNYKMLLNEAKSEAKSEAENINLTELEKRLCELLRENSKITQSEIQKRLGISRSKVQRTMKNLVNEGVIVNIGSHRRAHWKVN